eukprot:NODE_249_length_12946_cov_0.357438.p14 type:complete len:101 gc:universal NODE_249_length_12946_cov_0.357438:7795-7493(-)
MQIEALLTSELACVRCHKNFKEKSVLKRHVKNVHSSPSPCSYCGKLLKIHGRVDSLRNHLNRCIKFEEQLGTKDKNIIYKQAWKMAQVDLRENQEYPQRN